MRKRFIRWSRYPKKRAERLPVLLDVKDQKPIRGNRLAYRLIVPGKDGLAMRPTVEPPVEGAGVDDVVRDPGSDPVQHRENRGLDTVVPAIRIADGKDDLRPRVRGG